MPTCCTCVCDSGVSVRGRDVEAAGTVVLGTVAVVGGTRGAPTLFPGFWIVGLSWQLGVRRIRRSVLCLGSDRSGPGLNVVSGPRMARGSTEAAFDSRISTVIDERFVLHVREIDTPTLSPESP